MTWSVRLGGFFHGCWMFRGCIVVFDGFAAFPSDNLQWFCRISCLLEKWEVESMWISDILSFSWLSTPKKNRENPPTPTCGVSSPWSGPPRDPRWFGYRCAGAAAWRRGSSLSSPSPPERTDGTWLGCVGGGQIGGGGMDGAGFGFFFTFFGLVEEVGGRWRWVAYFLCCFFPEC